MRLVVNIQVVPQTLWEPFTWLRPLLYAILLFRIMQDRRISLTDHTLQIEYTWLRFWAQRPRVFTETSIILSVLNCFCLCEMLLCENIVSTKNHETNSMRAHQRVLTCVAHNWARDNSGSWTVRFLFRDIYTDHFHNIMRIRQLRSDILQTKARPTKRDLFYTKSFVTRVNTTL